jgi:hypothetical protein
MPTLIDSGLTWLSNGAITYKALAIVGFTLQPTVVEARPAEGRWALRATVEGGPSVLVVWSCPQDGRDESYGRELIASLDAHADDIAAGGVIVAGDSNIGQGFSGGARTDWTKEARTRWEELGLAASVP